MRSPKKSDSIEVRVPFDTKRAFAERCRGEGRTVSEAVRAYIDVQLDAVPGRRRRFARPLAGLLAAGGAAAILAVVPTQVAAERTDFGHVFAAKDVNRDGMLTPEEFGVRDGPACGDGVTAYALPLERASHSVGLAGRLRPFGFFMPNGAFAKADTNRDGRLSLSEYARQTVETLRAGFARLDSNRDGAISRAEHAAAHRIAFRGDPAPFAPFSELDRDRDGEVGWDEFLA